MRTFMLLFCLIFTTQALAQTLPTREYTLNNGLKLVVREDHRTPVVTVQVWYKIGSSYEHKGITGVSHILEHMMFKGTRAHPEGQFADIITKHGGVLNAFTSYDFTGYYESLPVAQLETALKLEADRMRNVIFSEDKFEKELSVVIEERRMRTDDIPENLTYERFAATAMTNSSYRHPIIGWPDDLHNATLKQSTDWYNQWYRPNNAIVVVVGDVTPERVEALVKHHFGSIKKEPVPEVRPIPELTQLGEKRITVQRPAHTPYLFMGYQTPSYLTQPEPWHAPALTLLASILDGGESARFAKNIVRNQSLAVSAFADYSPFMRQDNLFILGGLPQQSKTLADLENGIRKEIARIQNELVSKAELERAKIQFKANDIYSLDSISTQANMIGNLEAINLSWQDKDKFLEQIDNISAKQIQAVAKLYLNKDALTVAHLVPEKSSSQQGAQ